MQDSNSPHAAPDGLQPNDFILAPCGGIRLFTPEECRSIIEMSKDMPLVVGETLHDGQRFQDASLRRSEIKWLNQSAQTQWIFDKVAQVILHVNRDYRFELSGIEPMQVARYTDSGFYGWHADTGRGVSSFRKLSLSVQLSEESDYEGGDLEFQGMSQGYKPLKEIGAATVFPSFLHHRVTPVTSGTRWSMVAWIVGPPFR